MRRAIWAVTSIATLVLGTGAGVFADEQRDSDWREDLRFLTAMVREIHPRPFGRVPEARFDSAAASLAREIPGLRDHEVMIGLMRLVAMLEDGHSMVFPFGPRLGFHVFVPVRLYSFEDGLFVLSAAEPYARYAGAKVLRVGSLEAREALTRVLAITSGDNDQTRLDRAPLLLMMPRVLQAIGASSDSARVRFEVQLPNGSRPSFAAAVVPGPEGPPLWFFDGEGVPGGRFRTARDRARAPTPLHLRDPERPYWFEYLPEQHALYAQLRRMDAEGPGTTFGQFVDRLFAFADSAGVEALILDLRHNQGGDNTILQPLIHGLIQRERTINRPGRLFTIVGRSTFSAAMNCANWLEEHTHTLFVGEPTGARPNHYGDSEHVMLPHGGALVLISHWAWSARLPWDHRPWIAPHLPAPMTSADYRENRDPALAVIAASRAETRDR